MNIMICGSMTFSREMAEIKRKLEEKGHAVSLPCDIEKHLENPSLIDNLKEDLEHLKENKVLRSCFNSVSESEAILILNLSKNGIPGYIGTSTLMEMGLAYHLRKKIFIMNEIPESEKHRWAHEVESMEPTILNGDLSLIK